MKKIKTSTLWILVGVLFVAAIGLIVGCSYADGGLNKALIVLLAIDFILLTIVIQYASFKTFKYKPKMKKLPHAFYHMDGDIEDILNKEYTKRETEYGPSYLKIDGRVAYKVNLITDAERYFNPTEEVKSKPNKALDKCSHLVGLEIFINPSDEVITKLPDFTMEGDKIYYTALIRNDHDYECVNYLEPSDNHRGNVNTLFSELGLNKVEENVSI